MGQPLPRTSLRPATYFIPRTTVDWKAMRFLRYVAAALWLLAHCTDGGFAQPHAEPQAGTPPVPSIGAPGTAPAPGVFQVEQAKPDTYLLPDKDGQLQPMLGWTFEDFVRVWRSREEASPADEEPTYSLQRLECSGRLEKDDFVRLQVRIDVLLQSDRRLSIPLAFPNGILTDYEINSQKELEDPAYLDFDEDLGEHVLWIQGNVGQSCEVQLELLLPIARRRDQTVLRFHPPRALTSRLTLTAPDNGIVVESGSPAMQVSTTTTDHVTTIEALGLVETSEIAWRSVEGPDQDARSLVASSQARVWVEQALVQMEVSLTVQDLHGALSRFRVQLPAGFELASEDAEGATVHKVEGGKAGASAADMQPDAAPHAEYEVRLAEPQQTPFLVKFTLERPVQLHEDEMQLLLEGLHVVGAARQQGRLLLAVDEDLRVRWQEGHRIRQTAVTSEPPADSTQVAAFDHDAADWRLPVVLALRPTEISVEPDYRLEIGRDDLRLTATYRYSVRGTKRIGLRFALGPWELADDPLGPESTISGSNAYVDDSGTMYLPLTNPAEGTFETTLYLRMQRPTAPGPLQVRLPECLDGRVQDGELHVTADPSLEATPQPQSMLGLGPLPRTLPATAPPEPADSSGQHWQISSLPAEYVAVVRPRTRTILSETRAIVDVHVDHLRIEQEVHLEIRHLPANEVVVEVPAVLASIPSIAFEVEGQSIAPLWEEPRGEGGDEKTRLARIALEQPRLGGLSIRIRFQLPLVSSASGDLPRDVLVPLAVPEADAHHVLASLTNYTNELQVQFRRPTGVDSDTAASNYPVVNPGDRSRLELSMPVFGLPVTVRAAPTTSQRTLMVDRTWIQSWVAGTTMQTRTAMSFVPSSNDIVLGLGSAGSSGLQEVRVNGRAVSLVPVSDREYVLSTGDLPANAPCVIEIVQKAPFAVGPGGNIQIEPPRIADARYNHVFWQLILPQSLHGFNQVDEFVSASPWRNSGVYWARVPDMSQADLEDFVGVPHEPSPTGAVNELLLRGFELPTVLQASLVRRSTLVLVTSGIILAAGLIVLYVRALRRLEFAVAIVVLLAIAGTIYPDIAPLLAQAGILGLVLVVIAVFFNGMASQWQAAAARGSADTSIFRREGSSPGVNLAGSPSTDAASSARTLVPSLSDPGVQHSA